MATPTSASVLSALTQARLGELARSLGVTIPTSGRKDAQIARLIAAAMLPLPGWLGHLYRDELRAACRDHDLATESRSRTELAGRLAEAHYTAAGSMTGGPGAAYQLAKLAAEDGDIASAKEWLRRGLEQLGRFPHGGRGVREMRHKLEAFQEKLGAGR